MPRLLKRVFSTTFCLLTQTAGSMPAPDPQSHRGNRVSTHSRSASHYHRVPEPASCRCRHIFETQLPERMGRAGDAHTTTTERGGKRLPGGHMGNHIGRLISCTHSNGAMSLIEGL